MRPLRSVFVSTRIRRGKLKLRIKSKPRVKSNRHRTITAEIRKEGQNDLVGFVLALLFIGLFTIGGGQVAITLMYQELVDSGIIDAELFTTCLPFPNRLPGLSA